MAANNEMTINERRKYLLRMRSRYVCADRQERGQLLDEMEKVTELHRKSLIRLMRGDLSRQRRRRQRGRTYGAAVDDALRIIAESYDHPCAERLTPNLIWMAQQLANHGEMVLSQELVEQLGQMSVSTVRRILKRVGADERRLPRKGLQRANPLCRDVPMKRIPWNESEPGHFEVDLVHHCGPSASGEYVHTVQMVDVASGWSERVAVLGRSYRVMEAAFGRILARLPFPVMEIHPDNGSEFFNHHLLRFWKELAHGVQLSRSRPFQKNDNRFVEQKNGSLVRAYLGFDRFDSVAQTLAANELYDRMGLYYNLFQPVMHLVEKKVEAVEGQPGRIKRRHDAPRTPFDRLCATGAISPSREQELRALQARLNPRRLRREIYALRDRLLTLPGAEVGVVENVHEFLAQLAAVPAW